MDLDRYLLAHEAEWQAIEKTCAGAGARKSNLTSDQLERLLDGHQRVSAQLSYVRTHMPSRELEDRLSTVLSQTSAVIFEQRQSGWKSIVDFFVCTFPAATYSIRRFALIALLAMVIPGIAMGIWQYNSQQARDSSAPPEVRSQLLDSEFENYYSERPAHEFATQIFVNNSRVGFLAFGMGALGAIPAVLMMVNEGYRIGEIAGWFHAEGDAYNFWRLLLPHGMLELTLIYFAAGAGMALGWSLVEPGDRTRGRAFAEAGSLSASVVLGLAPAFLLSALVEAYVTPAPWHDAIRIGIGALALGGFLAYIWIYGRRAVSLGYEGRIGERIPLSKTT
ncbi:MAG: stage II sporulation protein M [Acidimicrobiales bacterium]